MLWRGGRSARCRKLARPAGQTRTRTRAPAVRAAGLLAGLLLVAMALLPTGAPAEPACTDEWLQPTGKWTQPSNWNHGVPTSETVACIGSGKTAEVTTGANQVKVVQGAGTLLISGGSLSVESTTEASRISSLKIEGGATPTLEGAGKIEVSSSLTWSSGTMSGSGSTVLLSGATGTIKHENTLERRTLVNEGEMTLEKATAATLTISEGGQLANKGTFKANAESGATQIIKGTGSASIVNSGLFERPKPKSALKKRPRLP